MGDILTTRSGQSEERFPNGLRTERAKRLHGIYTKSPAMQPDQRVRTGEKRFSTSDLALEAGSGIEPLYEDLQSSA